jgi:hypothetical protein
MGSFRHLRARALAPCAIAIFVTGLSTAACSGTAPLGRAEASEARVETGRGAIFRTLATDVDTLEQQCRFGGPEAQIPFATRQIARFRNLESRLTTPDDLYDRYGLARADVTDDFTASKDDSTATFDQGEWYENYLALDDAEKCDAVRTAYFFGVFGLVTVPPLVPILGFRDVVFDDHAAPATPEERERLAKKIEERRIAAWQLRYIKALPASDIPDGPNGCRDVKVDADLRWTAIWDIHRALGYAIGMCGRPNASHYRDEALVNQAPPGWSGAVNEAALPGNDPEAPLSPALTPGSSP